MDQLPPHISSSSRQIRSWPPDPEQYGSSLQHSEDIDTSHVNLVDDNFVQDYGFSTTASSFPLVSQPVPLSHELAPFENAPFLETGSNNLLEPPTGDLETTFNRTDVFCSDNMAGGPQLGRNYDDSLLADPASCQSLEPPGAAFLSLDWGDLLEYSSNEGVRTVYDVSQTLPSSGIGSNQHDDRGTNWVNGEQKPQASLPRRRSKYSLAHIPNNGKRVAIPIPLSSAQSSDPLQRWRDSPPETEAASFSAIFDALKRTDVHDDAGTFTRGGQQSSPSVDSWPSHSTGSAASTWSSQSNFLRNVQRTSSGRVSKSRSSGPRSKEKPRIFHCTFCCDTFAKKHDWVRHEKTRHLNCDQWICAPYGGSVVSPITLRSNCAYCSMLDPTVEHIEGHNHSACHNGSEPHIFRRKDHLIQHLRGFHQLETLPILDDWRIQPPVVISRCGFCNISLGSWQAREDHLAEHFREGATMADWKGDHGFEPSIAAQVRNAIPPYLLFNEAKTVIPFSATDPTVSDHLAQMVQEHRGPDVSIGDDKADGNSGNRIDPGFEVTPTSYTKFLAWHLGRFAQQSFSQGLIPTDQMFQDEARRLVYGSDDNWEQTIADNSEWLASFRSQNLPEER